MHVGKAVKKELKKMGRNQSWLARELDLSRQSVSKICEKEHIKTDVLQEIAKILNVKMTDLLK